MRDLFPVSANVFDLKSLLVSILIYIVASMVAGFVFSLVTWLPLVGRIMRFASQLIDLYCLAGIVVAIMIYFKLI